MVTIYMVLKYPSLKEELLCLLQTGSFIEPTLDAYSEDRYKARKYIKLKKLKYRHRYHIKPINFYTNFIHDDHMYHRFKRKNSNKKLITLKNHKTGDIIYCKESQYGIFNFKGYGRFSLMEGIKK